MVTDKTSRGLNEKGGMKLVRTQFYYLNQATQGHEVCDSWVMWVSILLRAEMVLYDSAHRRLQAWAHQDRP